MPTQAMSQAIFISAPGGPEVLQWRDTPKPLPGPGEVQIQVAYAGVNRHDCNQRRRGPTPAHSDIPGLEVSGVITELGQGVPDAWLGQRVCALTDGGAYGQFVVTAVSLCFEVPSSVTLAQAAALPEAMFTVWHNFFRVAAMQAGESALIHGGTSGVGTIAIQILRKLGHAVYVTCGTDEKCAVAETLGANAAFNYRSASFTTWIDQHTGGRGVDVILDMAADRYAKENVHALAFRGRLVHLSPGDGAEFKAPLRAIMAKEAKVTGSLLRALPLQEKNLIAQDLRRVVMPMVEDGRLRPIISRTIPMQEAFEAHATLESNQSIGKILLSA